MGYLKLPWKTFKFQTESEMHKSLSLFIIITQLFISEFLGTAVLVFIGCMGCIAEILDEGHRVGLAFCFGMGVFTAIQVSSHVSGGHVNPAVTLLSLFYKKIKWYMAPVYIVGQFLGAIFGFLMLQLLTPKHFLTSYSEGDGVCTAVPQVSLAQAFFAEFFFTSILLMVVCSGWDERNIYFDSFSLKVGFTVFALIYIGGAYTGCSMNIARAFAPSLLNGKWTHHWIYWLAPLIATGVIGVIYTFLFKPDLAGQNQEEKEDN